MGNAEKGQINDPQFQLQHPEYTIQGATSIGSDRLGCVGCTRGWFGPSGMVEWKERGRTRCLLCSELDERSGGRETGASTHAPDDVPSSSPNLHRPGDCLAAGNDALHPTPARSAAHSKPAGPSFGRCPDHRADGEQYGNSPSDPCHQPMLSVHLASDAPSARSPSGCEAS